MTYETKTVPAAEAHEQLWDLIKDIKFAMFTTRHSNGHLHARPMTTQNKRVDEDHSLWFFMSRSGEPVADIEAEPSVNVVYADAGKDSYVSVSGTARVVDNMAKREQLWNKFNAAWFPGVSGMLTVVPSAMTTRRPWKSQPRGTCSPSRSAVSRASRGRRASGSRWRALQ